MSRLAAIFCAWLGVSSAFADTLWVPPKDTFHLVLSLTGAQWDQFLQTGGTPVELPGDITQYELSIYGEYTPIENFSIDLQLPIVISQKKFVFLETDEFGNIIGVGTGPNGEVRDVHTNGGIGDTIIGAKYVFWERGASLGARAHLKIPGSYQVGDVVNAPGDGQVDFGLSFLSGVNLPEIRSYLRGSLGLTLRAGSPSNQFDMMIEPGFYITPRISARFLYQFSHQFAGSDINFYGFPNDYPSNAEDSHRIGIGLEYKATETFGLFTLFSQTVAGRNTANTKAFTLGMDLSF